MSDFLSVSSTLSQKYRTARFLRRDPLLTAVEYHSPAVPYIGKQYLLPDMGKVDAHPLQ